MQDKIQELQYEIEANPSNPLAYYNLGIYYDQQEKYGDAIKMYQKALELDSDKRFSAAVDIYLARIYRDNQDFSQAIEEYQKSVENAPYLKGDQGIISHLISKAHYELGMVYYEEALKTSRRSYLESAITKIREALNLSQKLPNEDWVTEARKNLEAIEKLSKRDIIISDENDNLVGIIPGDSDNEGYSACPTDARECLASGEWLLTGDIGECEVYQKLEKDPKPNRGFKKEVFSQSDGSKKEVIIYNLKTIDPYEEIEAILFWAPGRDEWVARTHRNFLEGYDHGRSLYGHDHAGPFVLNDDACIKILEAYGIRKEEISLETVKKMSPSELERLASQK